MKEVEFPPEIGYHFQPFDPLRVGGREGVPPEHKEYN